MVLVFVGTIVQVNLGLQLVQEHFFRSLIVWWPIQPHGMRFPIFPGGHLIGAVLLLNLVVALASRFEWSWRKSGHYLTHGGLIVMLVGALLTDMLSVESSMRLSQGETKNYQEDTLRTELAIVDETDTEFDQVTTIPLEQLRQGRAIFDPICLSALRCGGCCRIRVCKCFHRPGRARFRPPCRDMGLRLPSLRHHGRPH